MLYGGLAVHSAPAAHSTNAPVLSGCVRISVMRVSIVLVVVALGVGGSACDSGFVQHCQHRSSSIGGRTLLPFE